MRLSVIIVNYNVEYFLEQCLHSVLRAAKGLDIETIVVDNASVDGSVEMVREKFPEVTLIANEDNRGFSKANNQGIHIATGELILLLNPDTVVQEDTFQQTIAFMESHADCGGLGCMMLDGNGRFLPESKRGLPTPEVAFYKIFGLSALFPKSKRFNRYHLGYLDKDEDHEIEILSGAFMLMRKEALDKVGLLDEDFFMYGEDIDLSYRILQGGWKNYYTARTRIIHYKGESTKKSSVNYVFVFYRAMIIFARKHFSDKNARLFSFFINLAIYFRAAVALLGRAVRTLALPLLDGLGIVLLLWLVKKGYEATTGIFIWRSLWQFAFPVYALVWVLAMAFNGLYMPPIRAKSIVLGTVYGTIAILVGYSLIGEEYRFSRAIILLGSVAVLLGMLSWRGLLGTLRPKLSMGRKKEGVFALVGEDEEVSRVLAMMVKAGIREADVHLVRPASMNRNSNKNKNKNRNEARLRPSTEQPSDHISTHHSSTHHSSPADAIRSYSGTSSQLSEIIDVHKVSEVIFCAKDLRTDEIMDKMATLGEKDVRFRIAPPESLFIIGSDSKNSTGDLLAFELNSIGRRENRLNKRLFDVGLALLLLPFSPLLMWIQKRPIAFLGNLFAVLFGRKSWVGYAPDPRAGGLPRLRPGVLTPLGGQASDVAGVHRGNVLYSKDYSVRKDVDAVLEGMRGLGG